MEHKITPFLWYDGNVEEAINFYTSVFKQAKVLSSRRGPDGKVFTATFEIEGQRFMALNGGPHYSFTPAVSFFVNCTSQEEVDELWNKLSEGGEIQRCGWLKDKFGLSWQIIPDTLGKLLSDPDPQKAQRVAQAMMQMDKIDISRLNQAYNEN